ncbi:hypothetical protein PIB30_018978 [Stylosanthes scabra]|uniref:Uncharacterized protein n=1 Tax=Stylosanthes scabra TaxID=79078 RepID=A0ABU6Q7W9_9FABA|nr:hypothetical protein [Stylosanthes scabra]
MFCESDDISIERVALHDNWDDAEGYYRCWLGAWKPSWRDGWCACELACELGFVTRRCQSSCWK